jgi:hypothetical protein
MATPSTPIAAFGDLERAIEGLGLPASETIRDLIELYLALAKPSRLDSALRHLELEWLGARDAPTAAGVGNLRASLMHIASRSLAIGHVWAYGGADLHFPRWQFTYGRDGLPSGFISDRLQVIVAAIPVDANPALVRSLMTLSTPWFPTVRGREVSPREFILGGGSPSAVAAMLLRFLDADAGRFHDVVDRVQTWE